MGVCVPHIVGVNNGPTVEVARDARPMVRTRAGPGLVTIGGGCQCNVIVNVIEAVQADVVCQPEDKKNWIF